MGLFYRVFTFQFLLIISFLGEVIELLGAPLFT